MPRNAQLQRIYGTAWPSEKELDAYLFQLEEAEKRDHRRLGRELDLFHLQEEAVGSVFWHPKGWTLYRTIEDYMRRRLDAAGYRRGEDAAAPRPHAVGSLRPLGEVPREHVHRARAGDERVLAVKPMNCPGHVLIFRQRLQQLPRTAAAPGRVRLAATATSRRARCTASCGCAPSPRTTRTSSAPRTRSRRRAIAFCDLLLSVYRDFGFDDVAVKFADRPAGARRHATRSGTRPRRRSSDAVEAAGLAYTLNPGEGAFYGPKLEFVLRDAIGRDWQCGTLQLDFVLPERLDADYVGEDGQRHTAGHAAPRDPRLAGALHRHPDRALRRRVPALAGAGAGGGGDDHRRRRRLCRGGARRALRAAGLRVELDLRNEKINYKVREHSLAKVPVHAGGRQARGRERHASRCAAWAARSRKSLRSARPSLD